MSSGAFSGDSLYMLKADYLQTTKFDEPRFGIMVNHEGEGQEKRGLRGGVHNSNSLADRPRDSNPEGRTANVPQMRTHQVVSE